FFFFQAEDGIRDFHVTGVQTCALPIFTATDVPPAGFFDGVAGFDDGGSNRSPTLRSAETAYSVAGIFCPPAARRRLIRMRPPFRSEERRVGKECRLRWAPRRAGKQREW